MNRIKASLSTSIWTPRNLSGENRPPNPPCLLRGAGIGLQEVRVSVSGYRKSPPSCGPRREELGFHFPPRSGLRERWVILLKGEV